MTPIREKKSWNHQIAPLPYIHNTAGEPRQCTVAHKCRDTAHYAVSYNYVSGRRGRVTRNERTACNYHAEKFCRRHEIPVFPAHPNLREHKWHPHEALETLQMCAHCSHTRTLTNPGDSRWPIYRHEHDLTFCRSLREDIAQ
jgi:hypothetical protein